ncbi:MAG: class I SAM-dependent methyltransferase [Candidatus Margulisbacteria bacterium]|nr:class I SAM-dependent methyltransferase [Candidatus Margulisiibacteriota bacterium]MBU1022119.1 class I SAM-dependent methyltransferase [Candidatus Margulisiibacteriota bacterium]MBU1728635.1 class I SAM-dependent methyltransferase [Candidatus Margulisiibacteriota bacterium]MBU1955086.1 class I SAM-dependent methyltransferase [Candidatus Margulisiibacteriota bacterium]
MENIRDLYIKRFSNKECLQKAKLWEVLCSCFLQKYIPADSVVLDVGAGYCDFINNIKAKDKYAVDLNNDTVNFALPDVKVVNANSNNLSFLDNDTVDVVFMSNFLEHMANKFEINRTLTEIHRVCKIGGKVIIIQPNIRFIYNEYWDFYDHNIPLSDRSMVEALKIVGFRVDKVIPRFLPFTTKKWIPKYGFLLKLYLRLPIVWHILGKQMFILARKVK